MIIRKVVLGLSGGVDSAVSAYLLKQKGFLVEAVFMKNWDETDESGFCSSDKDFEDAKYVSDKLEIPLKQINFVKEYWNDVFCNFIKDYQNGLTPNPDILCNRQIKFNLFYNHAREIMKCDAIATGHYARSSFGTFLEDFKENKDVKLLQSEDTFKDQTFFLSQVPQSALRHCMFPVGSLNKHQVKKIAEEIGLEKIASRKESIGICFIGDRTFQSFISEYIDVKQGNFVDIDTGKVMGVHNGIHTWTLGQGCKISGTPKPYFVYRKDLTTSTIYVAAGTDHPFLWSDIFYTSDAFWISQSPILASKNYFKCQFRFQHTKPLTNCLIYKSNEAGDKLLVMLDKPLRSITPGQYAVFYKDGQCLGSSRITSSGPSSKFR
ncbi:unnamed protein product [Diamesa serratosioi]